MANVEYPSKRIARVPQAMGFDFASIDTEQLTRWTIAGVATMAVVLVARRMMAKRKRG